MVARRDPVTHETAMAVLYRDRGCIAVLELGAWSSECSGPLEIDHVLDQAGVGKARAKSDMAHLVTLCAFHHRGTKAGSNWATSHRPELRDYLRRVNEVSA